MRGAVSIRNGSEIDRHRCVKPFAYEAAPRIGLRRFPILRAAPVGPSKITFGAAL
jgi:hypothetical protein